MTLDELWTYVPPTPETAPKYAAIRDAGARIVSMIDGCRMADLPTFDAVRAFTLAFARVIEERAPASPDRAEAVHSVRLVRMLLNEYLVTSGKGGSWCDLSAILDRAEMATLEARFWACSAIALGGKA